MRVIEFLVPILVTFLFLTNLTLSESQVSIKEVGRIKITTTGAKKCTTLVSETGESKSICMVEVPTKTSEQIANCIVELQIANPALSYEELKERCSASTFVKKKAAVSNSCADHVCRGSGHPCS